MAAEDVFGIVGTTQAGNFHVERVVAQGGFGVVYRALHGGFRAPVAIKCLKIPDEMNRQQREVFLEKFREEAELTFRLSAAIGEVCRPLHVDVLMLGDGRFVPFLAMEWLEGESLDAIVTRRREQGLPPLGLHKVVKMMRPVAVALAKAHRFPGPQGAIAIIHRDLKPENLMIATIGGTESMKILDFGIAKAKRAASQAAGRVTGRTLAEDETASFTPAYGAPEQWAPKSWGETGPWTDVWGLALSMVEALCGKPPIDGEPWVMRRVCLDEKRRPTPRNSGADVPLEVDKVFEQALAVDPRKRYKTIEAFWSDLERAMGLPQTLGPRDDRREPGDAPSGTSEQEQVIPIAPSSRDAAVPSSKKRAGDALAPAGERLARIELTKMPVPAGLASPGKAGSGAAGLVGGHPQTPAADAAKAAKPPPPKADKASSSGNWEFDLGAAAPPHDAPPSSPRAERSEPKPSPRRKASMEFELPLPSRSEPPPPLVPSALEMSLPIVDGSSYVAAPVEPPPPSRPSPAAPPAPVAKGSSTSGEFLLDAASEAVPSSRARAEEPLPVAPSRPSGDGALGLDLDLPQRPSYAAPAVSPATPLPAARVELGQPNFRGPAGTRAPLSSRMVHDVKERLRAPVGILVAALVIAGADTGWQRLTGEHVSLGPVRLFWIAAPLAIFGVGFTLWRLMEDHDG